MQTSWHRHIVCCERTVLLLLIFAIVPEVTLATQTRPFWTEKSAFIEGDDLFVTGVASKVRTVEDGRQLAFEHGKVELMNYAQLTSLEAQGLVIETQMTYEEINVDGSVTVFRLLRVPVEKLQRIQGALRSQSKVQEHTLAESIRELVAIQHSLNEKAFKREEQQRKAEQLLQQLSLRSQALGGKTFQPPKPANGAGLLDRLREAEAKLDAEEHEYTTIATRVEERVNAEKDRIQTKCKYLRFGMRENEVEQIMGKPDRRFPEKSEKNTPSLPVIDLSYGQVYEVKLYFNIRGHLER